MDDIDETQTQGALFLGPQQVSPEGRPYRPRAQGKKKIESTFWRDPKDDNEPGAINPSTLREPPRKRASRPLNIPHDPSESQLHETIARLLDLVLKPPSLYTTFPAGWGKLSKGTAGRLFASGLKKGMPDILVFGPDATVAGIELKVGHNSVSSAQRNMFAKLQAVGITVYVCRNQEDVIEALRAASIPFRDPHLWTCSAR